jgi:hypothetical protein
VLINEWSHCIDVALGTNSVLGRTRLKKLWLEGAVRIVTVAALQQPLIDAVMEWLCKGRLDVGMALIAEGGLLRLEHCRLGFKLVCAVTAYATNLGLAVTSALEVGVFANVT